MIAVVDACSGNLRSVRRALEEVGGVVSVTSDPEVIRTADKVVVPGQGAFGEFAKGISERGLGEALREALRAGKPFLGICLGLQVLFEDSEEGGTGLGLLDGHVVRFRGDLKVPHIGWNQVWRDRAEPMLEGIDDGAHFYFVHSYYPVPVQHVVALRCDYGDRFCAAIRHENLFAVQFHPEKSQATGLRLLKNFVCG